MHMEKQDIKEIAIKTAVRETAIIASCAVAAFGIVKFMPGAAKSFFPVKLAAFLYLVSIALRVAGIFIRMSFKVAFMLGMLGILLLVLSARYPTAFAFLK